MSRLFNSASSQYLSRTSPAWAGPAPLTFACWYRHVDTSALRVLMSFANSADATNNQITLSVDPVYDVVVASYRATANNNATAATGTTDANWHHAAGTFESGQIYAYFDGAQGAVKTHSQSPAGMNRLGVGVRPSSTYTSFWDGYIAHAAIWTVALTAAEVALLGAGRVSPLAVRPQNLWRYWRLDGSHDTENCAITGDWLNNTGATLSAESPPQLWLPGRRRIFLPAESGAAVSLSADSGTYALSGQSASLRATRTMAAGQGAYSLTGQDIALTKSSAVSANYGAYALTGQTASLLAVRAVVAEQGGYALTGTAAGLNYTVDKALSCSFGTYSVTGQTVSIVATRTVELNQGAYSLTGQGISPIKLSRVAAGGGVYTYTGRAANLAYSGGSGPAVPYKRIHLSFGLRFGF